MFRRVLESVLARVYAVWLIAQGIFQAQYLVANKKEIEMKKSLLVVLLSVSTFAIADNYVNGYVRKDGTYVQPHYQTQSDRNPYNNYSTQGNSNPYTGQQGYRDPVQVQQQYAPQQPNYNSGSYGNPYGQPSRRSNW